MDDESTSRFVDKSTIGSSAGGPCDTCGKRHSPTHCCVCRSTHLPGMAHQGPVVGQTPTQGYTSGDAWLANIRRARRGLGR